MKNFRFETICDIRNHLGDHNNDIDSILLAVQLAGFYQKRLKVLLFSSWHFIEIVHIYSHYYIMLSKLIIAGNCVSTSFN